MKTTPNLQPARRRLLSRACCLLALLALAPSLRAAVPLRWPVETSRLQPASFDAYHGETLAFEAALKAYGTALQLPTNAPAALYYQTNGMESAWWQIPASVTGNVLSATFAPSNDCGAASYDCFLGITGSIYRAAFRLRFRHAPGATPNVIAKPVPILDLANTTVINPPWPTDDTIAATVRQVIAQDGITAGLSSNEVKGVITQTVTRAYIESTGFSSGLDTNAVKTLIAQETADSLKNHGDATITGDPWYPVTLTVGGNDTATDPGLIVVNGAITDAGRVIIYGGGESPADLVGGQLTLADISNSITNSLTPAEVTIGDLKVRQTVTNLTTNVAALAAKAASFSNSVAAITARLNGEDAKVTVTNYNSATHLAETSLDAKIDSTWRTIWREMTRWNAFTGTNFNWSAWPGLTDALAQKAHVQYAFFDGTTGDLAPAGFFWVTQPKLALASGLNYNRYLSGQNEIWVLESNGLIPTFNDATSNGFFRVSDVEGNAQFEIVKGSSRLVHAAPNSMVSTNFSGISHFYVEYYVTNAVSAPIAYFSTNLTAAAYSEQTASDCPSNCSWHGPTTENGIDRYVLEWWPKDTYPQLFVYAKYGSDSSTKIVNHAPVQFESIVINNVTYSLSTATIDGHTVLTLTAQ